MRRRFEVAAIEMLGRHGVQGVVDERRFAGAGNTGDAGEQPHRNRGIDGFQIIAVRAADRELTLRVVRRALHRDLDAFGAGQELSGHGARIVHDFERRALCHDLPAVHAGTRADVEHVVGRQNRFLVVLDHDHGVADVAQMPQGFEQACVVALVQADGRFVEHVHHAHQARADLRGQPDALRLATRKGFGGARQTQIIEADVHQKAEAALDFLHNLTGDFAALAVELEAREELQCAANR